MTLAGLSIIMVFGASEGVSGIAEVEVMKRSEHGAFSFWKMSTTL